MFDRRHPAMLLFQTSIGHLSWPKSASIFFDQCRWIMFFCRGWLMFSLPSKWEHAGVGRNTTSVPLERKNLADLRCKFLRRHNKKASSIVKETLSASVCKKKKKKLRNVGWKISVAALQRPMSAIVFSIQSLNNIWMMSIRKCAIGAIRWGFFSKPRSVIFPGRRRFALFSISAGESHFFFRGGLIFSWPSKWEHASVGRNTVSVQRARKTLADLHCKIF